MLERCTAFVIAGNKTQRRSLETIARRLGLETVLPLAPRSALPAIGDLRPISFFLIHHQLDQRLMRLIVDAIRACPIDRVRYAPILLFVDDCLFDEYLNFLHMGFDDALALPDKREMLMQRLKGQLLTPQLYIRTASYFGPDRRRFDLSAEVDQRRGVGEHWHERITFFRDPGYGVTVIRTQHVLERDGRRHEA